MGADKSAILQSAQLFTARGQFDKAIAEWKKLTDGTPADGTIYNSIGDLHLKRNASADAVESYLKAAAAFQEGEAALKAIALYKKILKVDPNRAEAYRRLGALNAERGLVSNAVSDYLILARLYLQSGKGRDALEVYRTIASLDASNLEAQQRIAELSVPGQQAAGSQDQTQTKTVTKPAGPSDRVGQEGGTRLPEGHGQEIRSSSSGLRSAPRESEPSQPERIPAGSAPSESGQAQGEKWQPGWSRQDFINEAARLTAADRYSDAESLLSELLNREPGDPEVCRLLAVLHLRSGQLASATAEFRFLAEAAIRAQDFKLAEAMLLECLRAVPDSIPLIELLGRVYEQAGDAESASSQYGRALEVLLGQPDPDQPGLPLEFYERIKSIAPSSPLVARFAPVCGSVSVRQGVVEPREPLVSRAEPSQTVQKTAGHPEQPIDRPAAAFKFTEAHQGREQTQQAEAAPSEPAAPSFESGTVEVKAMAGPSPAAGDPTIEQAGPYDASHYELGLAYQHMGLRDEAIEELRQVGKGTEWFVDASLVLAACLKEQGLNGPAIAPLEDALADCRGEGNKAVMVRYELGLLYEAEGLFEQACQQFSVIPDFRDVSQRLERIASLGLAEQPASAAVGTGRGGSPPEKHSAPGRKKRRISYL